MCILLKSYDQISIGNAKIETKWALYQVILRVKMFHLNVWYREHYESLIYHIEDFNG